MYEELKKYKHIIFGAEHYNPLGIVRSLGENGIKPIGVIISSKRKLTSKSKYFSRVYIIDSIEEGYKKILEIRSNEKNKAFLYTSDDRTESFLDERYDEIIDKFYFFNAGEAGRVNYFMNKWNILEIAKKHGLPVAETTFAKKGEIPDGLQYPIITKSIASIVGGWKNDVYVCNSEEELIEAYKHIEAHTVLLQRYIEKKNELEYYGFCIDHGKKTFIADSVDYTYLMSKTYSHFMNVFDPVYPDIQEKIKSMFAEIGFEGIWSLEFVVDKAGNLYFLEVNFRNATWSYASTKAGMPLPLLWAHACLINDVRDEWHKSIDKGFTAMVEPDYLRNRVKTKKVSVSKFLREMKDCNCLYYLNKKDIKPIISWMLSKRNGR